jgi:hypothetical protein
MSDIDRIFARMGGRHATSSDQRETRNIPRKGGSTGSRVVEVVRLPASGTPVGRDQSHRTAFKVRAQTWDDGFPARSSLQPSPASQPVAVETAAPVAHVMPMWQPATTEADSTAPAPMPLEEHLSQVALTPRRDSLRKVKKPTRRVADPFDANDDGANCLRCGYAVEPARERRGLRTCAACG